MAKDFFKSRAVGFYLTAGAALLMIVTIIVYPIGFYQTSYDFKIELFMILGLILMAILLVGGYFLKGLDNWAPAVLGLSAFMALLYYALSNVEQVIRVVGGYEAETLPFVFFFVLAMLGLTIILCSVSIFLRQAKVQNNK